MNIASDNDTVVPAFGRERSLHVQTEKTDFVEHILRSLDAVIFLQIGCLYFCDNLTLLLFLRSVSQVLNVQSRPPPFASTAQLVPVIFVNLLCFLIHLLQARPEAGGWVAHGYLHGGLIVDFVGEQGPITKWRLVSQDSVILTLQLLMLVVGYEQQKLTGTVVTEPEHSVPQDIEAEEEGRRRSREGSRTRGAETEDGIELRSLLSTPDRGDRSDREYTPETGGDGVLLELNLRSSLKGLLNRGPSSPSAVTTSRNEVGLARLLATIAAARARGV